MSELTLGQKRVKAEFNPAKDDMVSQIKDKAAELIDLLESQRGVRQDSHEMQRLISIAQTEVETAAMYGVKAVFTD